MARFGEKPSFGEMLLQHLIVFLFAVAFPGATTMVAPVSWVSLSRSGDAVHCTTRTCVFFVVPFKVQQVVGVTEFKSRERAGGTETRRKFGKSTNETVHVDGEGFLQILGKDDQTAEISVSPASLQSVIEKCNHFMDSADTPSTTIFTIANWKFGALMGGVLTSLTVLCVVGYSLAILKFLASPFLSFGRAKRKAD